MLADALEDELIDSLLHLCAFAHRISLPYVSDCGQYTTAFPKMQQVFDILFHFFTNA